MKDKEDAFPIGMRVLAMDDDHASLKYLWELLLKKCQYHVTITSEAIAALKLLQDDKRKFDLIIVDANMPGMNGRKLFENVASLNISIPFILLSSNLSLEFIMERVTYGACDFMSKPVQLHELQNVWRHVVRRRNESNIRKLNTPDSAPIKSFEAPQKFPVIENVGHNRKPYGKRKDHTNEDCEHKGKHDVPLNQKKHRMVWTQDLHSKFIAVVDKLRLENAVPKKILELMNDENLTRENVASHLQKHRLSLKKSNQPANKITSFGGSSNSACGQNVCGVVDNIQSIANNIKVSHSVPSGVLSSSEVTQWGQASTFMNKNDNIYSSIQMVKQNILYGLSSTPLLESESVKQPSVTHTSFVSDFPSNLRDFSGFRYDWAPIQSPSLPRNSNDSRENMLTYATAHVTNSYNENQAYQGSHIVGLNELRQTGVLWYSENRSYDIEERCVPRYSENISNDIEEGRSTAVPPLSTVVPLRRFENINGNENETSVWISQNSEFCNPLMEDDDLLSSEGSLLSLTDEDFSLLMELDIGDNSQFDDVETMSSSLRRPKKASG